MREWELHLGDALRVLPGMPDGSVDAVVADPPAAISFMSLGFDTFKGRDHFIDWLAERMAQCLRVLKPGGYALVWALPRTSHWTATALEDAGFEIRDKICHLFGQGFPKGKACLKPGYEEWILCRRPGPRVLPLNIEEARVPTPPRATHADGTRRVASSANGNVPMRMRPHDAVAPPAGRWPANVTLEHSPLCVCRGTKRVRSGNSRSPSDSNGVTWQRSQKEVGPHYASPDGTEEVEDWVCHPECAVFLLDSQAGERTSGGKTGAVYARSGDGHVYGDGKTWGNAPAYSDTGSPSRFFYTAKASRADRGEGNDHPCTKSTELMQWLVRLVSKPGETVLDPFMGSGSTGVSCLRIERRFIGVEHDPHYFEIAQRRLAAVDGPLFARPAGEAVP